MWYHFHGVFFSELSLHLVKITVIKWVEQWYHNNIYINFGLAYTKYLMFSLVKYHR